MDTRLQKDQALREMLAQIVTDVDAEEGSLLMQTEQGMMFLISHSPVAKELEGQILKSGRGIVGCCYSFQQPMAVNQVQSDPAHDPSIDALTGITTRSEAVVPVSNANAEHGCLTAINSRKPNGFSTEDLARMNQAAQDICARVSQLLEASA